jgi:hypothetical protein
MTARLWIGVGGAGSADAPSLPSGRRCEDFGHRDLADGLPEGFSSDAADPLASHAVVEKVGSLSGRVLRTLNDRDALGTFVSWDALDGQTDVEVYVRASWTHVGDPTSHGTRALAVFTNRNEAAPREYRLGVNIDGAEAFKWDPSYDLALGRRQMLLSGDGRYDSLMVEPLNVLLRVVGGRVRGSMWTDDAPWNTWLWDFFDPSPSPLAGGQVGWMAGLFNETLDVEFISAGVGGADAPMPGVSAGFAPWRPDVSVALADGVATFTGSDFTDPAGRTHASSRWRVYALPVDDDSRYRVSAPQLVHDSDWQAEDLQTRILTGLSMGSEYGVTVEYRNQDGVTSAPAMLTWFHLGASLARSGHQDGYDLLGTVSPDCNSVPADETVTVAGMPPGFSVLREHADGQLTPYSFLGGARFPTPMVAGLDGSVTFTVPEADGSPVVALRLFGRTRRKSGDAPTAVLDVETVREYLGRLAPAHGVLPGDAYRLHYRAAPARPTVSQTSASGAVRLTSSAYSGASPHAFTRWRVWETHATCPTLVYDSGWSVHLTQLDVDPALLPAGWSSLVTATFKDTTGALSEPSVPLGATIPWAVPPVGVGAGYVNTRAQMVALAATLDEASVDRRPDALSSDYLSAHSTGPVALGDVSGGTVGHTWRARFDPDSSDVLLSRATDAGDAWGAEGVLLHVTGAPLLELDVAFDQNARPVLCCERATGAGGASQVWLYRFDSLLGDYSFTELDDGRTPRIVLDDPFDTTASDLLVFYMSDAADRLVFRQQRDRYATRIETPVSGVASYYVERAMRTTDNRVRVLGSVHDATRGTWAFAKLDTSLYPYHASTEGVDLSAGALDSSLDTILAFASMDAEGVGLSMGALDSDLVEVLHILPTLPAEGVDLSMGAADSLGLVTVLHVLPSLPTEGVNVTGGASGGTLAVALIIHGSQPAEGVNISGGALSGSLVTV